MIDIRVRRVLTREQATALIGERIPDTLEPSFSSPKTGEIVRLIDDGTDELIGFVTKLAGDWSTRLHATVTGLRMSDTGRARAGLDNGGNARVFGWSPKRPLMRRDACKPAGLANDAPDANMMLSKLGGVLGTQFRQIAPDIAEHDLELLEQVHKGWLIDEESLWTSGVINRTSQLPYHRDTTNFPTWSAMPTIRYRMRGGHLHLPEYDIVFPCGEGDVTWFCGKELVHGVTPMWTKGANAYRYSIVYYALKGMKDCATVAEETAESATRRTTRERKIADDARQVLAQSRL